MKITRNNKGILLLLLIFISFSSFSQEKCNTEVISHRIDSICKANNVEVCQINLWVVPQNKFEVYSIAVAEGTFKLDDCLIIVNETEYYDLSKVIKFYIYPEFFVKSELKVFKKGTPKKALILYLQGL